MQRGDLSNRVSPSLVIVFEGAIGILKDEDKDKYAKAVYRNRWKAAIDLYYLDELYLHKITDLIWRQGFNIEVCTWLGDDAAPMIGDRLDEENIPVSAVWASTPAKLSRQLAHLPRIMCVYDPDPSHVFTYGSKGVLLTSPHQLGRIN